MSYFKASLAARGGGRAGARREIVAGSRCGAGSSLTVPGGNATGGGIPNGQRPGRPRNGQARDMGRFLDFFSLNSVATNDGMDPTLKLWAQKGLMADICLALQTASAFGDLREATGLTKDNLRARLSRPLRSFKEPMRKFVAALDDLSAAERLEPWQAWGAIVQLRETPPVAADAAVAQIAARWGISPNTLARGLFKVIGAMEPSIRVEDRAGDWYVHVTPPPPAGTLTIRAGPVPAASLVGGFLEWVNHASRPVDARRCQVARAM